MSQENTGNGDITLVYKTCINIQEPMPLTRNVWVRVAAAHASEQPQTFRLSGRKGTVLPRPCSNSSRVGWSF